MESEILKTKRGKPCLLVDGYLYRQHRKNPKCITWLCLKEKMYNCRGRIQTDLQNAVLQKTDHSCIPNAAEIEVKKRVEICKKRVEEDISVPVNVIFKEEFSEIYNKGLDLVTKIPTYSSIKTSLCRVRRKVLGTTKNPADANDLNFGSGCLELPNGENFLRLDVKNDEEKRILVFGGEEAKSLLENGQIQKQPCTVIPRKQKRYSRSSLSEDGEESGTDTSTSSLRDSKTKCMNSPKKRMNVSPSKNCPMSAKTYLIATLDVSPTFLETSPSDEVKTQLIECVEEAMRSQFIMTLSDLKELVSDSHLSALCNRTDFEKLLHEALINCGAQKLKNKWPQNTTPEPLYAFTEFGNKLDRYRNILLELFSATARARTNFFVKRVEDELREIISESDCRQIFEDYCVHKSGFYYLKGTISLDSQQ